MQRRLVVSKRVGHRAVDQFELDVRVVCLDLLHPRRDCVADDDIACAFRAQNAETHDRRAVEAGECPRLGDGIGDQPEIVEPHFASDRQRDAGGGKLRYRLGAGKRPDGLFAAADLGPPASEIDVAAAQLAAYVERRQADALQPDGIEPDANFALNAPMRSTRATPRTPCSARITTSSTNQEICSGVLPGAIAA